VQRSRNIERVVGVDSVKLTFLGYWRASDQIGRIDTMARPSQRAQTPPRRTPSTALVATLLALCVAVSYVTGALEYFVASAYQDSS
jgi:hypothetical protein